MHIVTVCCGHCGDQLTEELISTPDAYADGGCPYLLPAVHCTPDAA